jgi:hypothetical protein
MAAARPGSDRLTIARHHNLTAYARVYKRHRRVHIPEFLTPESANRLHEICARGEQPVPKFVADLFTDADFLFFVRAIIASPAVSVSDAKSLRQAAAKTSSGDSYSVPKSAAAGFEISLSKAWRADWGGVLVFLGEEGNVVEGYSPAFNALNIFSTAQPFLITQVATFAAAPRLSIVGSMI